MALLLSAFVLASSVAAQGPVNVADEVVGSKGLRHGVAAPVQMSWWGGSSSAPIINTEPDDDGKKSIAAVIREAVETQLHGQKQWVNALIASSFGILLVVDGDLVFKWVVLAAIFLLSMILTSNEVGASWGLPHENHVRVFVSFEAGLLTTFAAWIGLQGVMLAIGGLVGCVAAHGLKHAILHVYPAFEHMRWLVVVWYSVFVVGIAAMVNKRKHLGALAILAPFLGGALLSSACCWWYTTKVVDGKMPWVYSSFPALKGENGKTSVAGGAWLDFFEMLVSDEARDVGIFAGGAYDKEVFGHKCRMDRIIGLALWAVFAVVGMAVQLMRIKKRRAQAKSSAMQSLAEPLVK